MEDICLTPTTSTDDCSLDWHAIYLKKDCFSLNYSFYFKDCIIYRFI